MIGEMVGNFRVISRLGGGGMGEVWLAEHKDIRTRVAIKVLLPHVSEHKDHVARFFNEAVAVSKIKHAGIAKIFDVGYHARGEAYLVMEFLDGEPLAARIARGAMSIAQAADAGRQIATVLEATHAAGITHRDLKPDNIFLVADAELDSGERIKVLDFGIAKLGGGNAVSNTAAGTMMGTPLYMSPEQWISSAQVDGRSDLYSLGCLVFEMVSGRPPYYAPSVGELCNLHLNTAPPALSSRANVPPALDELVARLLAKQPEHRPSIREVKAAFSALGASTSRVFDAPTTTLGGSALVISTMTTKRRSKAPIVIGLVVGVAAVIGGVAFSQRGGDPEATTTATIAAPPADAPVVKPEPAAVTSRVTITTEPADASISIDDAEVITPFAGTFPRNDVRHRVHVRAPGYKPTSQWVTFELDRQLVIALEREDVVAKQPAVQPAVKQPVKQPVKKPPPTTTTTTTTATGSAAPPPPPPQTGGSNSYKGTKGTIMTEMPKN